MYFHHRSHEMPGINSMTETPPSASLRTSRNRQDLDYPRARTADIWQQEYAPDGAGAERQ